MVRAPSGTKPQQQPRLPLWALVRRPAQITLAVTLLRLAGEKLDGAPELFSRDAGGGLAWVGIAWLAPVFGFFFGWKLQRRGLEPPSLPRLLGLPVVALLLPFVAAWVVAYRHPLSWTAKLGLWGCVSVVAGVIAALAWPAIGRLLFAYALLARLPVVLLMAAAMRFRWGTHYDALPPGFPDSMPLLGNGCGSGCCRRRRSGSPSRSPPARCAAPRAGTRRGRGKPEPRRRAARVRRAARYGSSDVRPVLIA